MNVFSLRRWDLCRRLLPSIIAFLWLLASRAASAQSAPFTPPDSPRSRISFDFGWRFIREDAPGAEAVEFDDSKWTPVTTPHTFNDIDTFNRLISHSGGQQGQYTGVAWYRKHFKLAETDRNKRVVLEFEGMRQAGDIFLNGKPVGLYENGVTTYGVDVTRDVIPGGADNLLAVKVDNSTRYLERATGVGFEWESKDFNPNYGGINRHVWLHVCSPIHQTLPVYYGLKTSGIYVFSSNISVNEQTADIYVQSEVANESDRPAEVSLSVVLVDSRQHAVATFEGDHLVLPANQKANLTALNRVTKIQWWQPTDPNLYDVYTLLSVDHKVIDVVRTRTGFRKTDFRGGVGTGGVFINDKFVYLTGYAQRSTNEWAGLGQAYPDWMHDLTARLIRDSNANYIRWMHVAPQPVDVAACDRFGIVQVCPAGDKEKDVNGPAWDQRIDVMRDTIISYRNNPSALFWEAGNNGVSAAHLQQMLALKSKWDPAGGRAMGCRSLNDPETTQIAQYFGVMIGEDPKSANRKTASDLFRGFSDERRDRAPFLEAEDFRDEAARRFWDDASPPHFGFKAGPKDTYSWNSETFRLAAAGRYWDYWSNRISNHDPAHPRWAGYASIYFSDSNADGRQDSSEVCRVSGKVDAVRLPKEAYFTYRVMQNPKPDIHILGHWTYPESTRKSVYVICNCDKVELQLDGRSVSVLSTPPLIR